MVSPLGAIGPSSNPKCLICAVAQGEVGSMPKAFLDKQLDSIADARAVEISPAMLERGRLIWNDIMSRSDKPRSLPLIL